MTSAIMITLSSAAVFLVLFINLALNPKISRRIIGFCALFTAIGGLIVYGTCYSSMIANPLLAILRSVFSVCTLFLGESGYEQVCEAPLFQYVAFEVFFWILQFMGIFSTTGAAVSVIGSRFLNKLRLYVLRRKPLSILYRVSQDTVEFGGELAESSRHAVLFIDESPDSACAGTIASLNCVLRSDAAALSASVRFLKSIGISGRRRHIHLYVLSQDETANRMYAAAFLTALEALRINPDKTSLTILGPEDETENRFLETESRYGFGNVISVNPPDMAARLLMRRCPPNGSVAFDDQGRALQNFHALVIGCGLTGQAVIKQLVMNGQFVGSNFRLTLFDPHYDEVMGKMLFECQELFKQYSIDVYRHDARSGAMYEFLTGNLASLRYIVVATGEDSVSNEIARQLRHFLALHGSGLNVYLCSSRGVRVIGDDASCQWNIYTADVLSSERIDRLAMLLNHGYCHNDLTPEENWRRCDYFSRMSSRASADYASSFLRMAHISAESAASGHWVQAGPLLEHMARSEHLRWNAFHFAMGFRPMTPVEWQQRCAVYRAEIAEHGSTKYRIGKDVSKRIHSCLIGWDALDSLSAAENAVTGGHVDYKQIDRDNVLSLPALLRAAKEDNK